MKPTSIILFALIISINISAREYHVAKNGNNKNPGTINAPLLTIQAAAEIALPGDVIIVHQGTYREQVTPPQGGESNEKRIVFRTANNEKVEIKGSEIIKGWKMFTQGIWKVTIPNSFFGKYNPYKDIIRGDWFNDLGREHHTGDVYLNGQSMWEMAILEKVLNPKSPPGNNACEGSTYTWYCENDEDNTYIYANFQEANPNEEQVEINVRKSCFYPEVTGINFITIKGFKMSHAATQWAPPTAEQTGLIGTNWSKGWIIEDNIISDSRCSGITLGKYGDQWDNTSEDSAEGYVETIHRALINGWNKKNIGHHIIRNNTIYNCEQTGICGSMGGIFSVIENNDIYNIWRKRQFTGAEMGGVKIHASIDMVIKNNRFSNCGRGLWLDWMAQGTRVTGNLFYQNTTDDLFVEVNHGPFLIDNNILLSELSIRDWSEGGAYVHNLIAGSIELKPQGRLTPYQKPHSTQLAGLKKTLGGDNRYYNNIFSGGAEEKPIRKSGLGVYKNAEFPMFVDGNVYLNGAQKFSDEINQLSIDYDPSIQVEEKKKAIFLSFTLDNAILQMKNKPVTSELLGKARIPAQGYENPDGSSITINKDYFGENRDERNPTPGPFENLSKGEVRLKIREK